MPCELEDEAKASRSGETEAAAAALGSPPVARLAADMMLMPRLGLVSNSSLKCCAYGQTRCLSQTRAAAQMLVLHCLRVGHVSLSLNSKP